MLQRILDTVTIVFPAVVAILGILHLTGWVPVVEAVEQVLVVILSTAAAVASIWFNYNFRHKVTKL
jgi:hypothetical protein